MPDPAENSSSDQNKGGNLADAADAAAAATPARPDWAPEKYWDADKGALKAEDLAKDHAALGERFAKGKSAFADEVRLEVRDALLKEQRKDAPEKPDGYSIGIPKQGVPDDLVILEKPPGADFQPEPGKKYFIAAKPDDPLVVLWRDVAHKAGLSQAEFDAGIVQFASHLAARVPTADERRAQQKAFYDSLGEKGAQRAEMLWGALKTTLGEDTARALDSVITGRAQVEALERLVEKAGGPKFTHGTDAAGARDVLTLDKLRAMQTDPKYWREKDPAFVAEVTEGYKKLFPSETKAA